MSPSILHLITTLDRGGAEKALLHLASAQAASREARQENRIDVAYLKGEGELTPEFEAAGVRVHDLRLAGLAAVGAYGRARRLVRRLAPDVLHTHLFKADTLGAALASSGRDARVLVSTKHNEDVYLRDAKWRALGRRVAARSDAVIAITPGVARFVRETLGDSVPRLATIAYGLPPPSRTGHRDAFRNTHGIGPDETVILCVGRFAPQKDHATLLEALSRMKTSARLVLVGRGPLEADLRRRATDLRVVFAGFVEDPTDAYAASDLITLNSVHEGLGLVLIEAAQHAIPAVATHVGGIPDVVEGGVTGLLVPPCSPTELAHALDTLVTDPERRATLGAAARARVTAHHDLATCAAAHERLYNDVLGWRPTNRTPE